MFFKVEAEQQTRGGIVTAQYLLKSESPGSERDYCWIVRWENQGGLPFGSAKAPTGLAPQLASFGAKATFTAHNLGSLGSSINKHWHGWCWLETPAGWSYLRQAVPCKERMRIKSISKGVRR